MKQETKEIKCAKCGNTIYIQKECEILKDEICYKCSPDYDQELKNDEN